MSEVSVLFANRGLRDLFAEQTLEADKGRTVGAVAVILKAQGEPEFILSGQLDYWRVMGLIEGLKDCLRAQCADDPRPAA